MEVVAVAVADLRGTFATELAVVEPASHREAVGSEAAVKEVARRRANGQIFGTQYPNAFAKDDGSVLC